MYDQCRPLDSPYAGEQKMKAIVGFAFFLLFLAGFAFVMMLGREAAEQNMAGGGASLTGVHWRLVSVSGDTIAEESGMFLSIDVDGSVKGHGGCNRFFGSLEMADAGLKFGPLGATRMACPEPIMNREMEFFEALQETRQFRSDSDGMHLLDAQDKALANLVNDAE
jgi:heat shock protein HslJ